MYDSLDIVLIVIVVSLLLIIWVRRSTASQEIEMSWTTDDGMKLLITGTSVVMPCGGTSVSVGWLPIDPRVVGKQLMHAFVPIGDDRVISLNLGHIVLGRELSFMLLVSIDNKIDGKVSTGDADEYIGGVANA